MAVESAVERIVVKASPERCYEVASDFEAYPEWARDIKHVVIKERDEQSRPSVVTFVAEAVGRSTEVTIRYDYTSTPAELSWTLVHGDVEKQWEGRFIFNPAEEGTELIYEVTIDLKVPIPPFLKRRFERKIMQAVNSDLKARAET